VIVEKCKVRGSN